MRRAYQTRPRLRSLFLVLCLSAATLQPHVAWAQVQSAPSAQETASLSQIYNEETDRTFRLGLQIRLAWTGDYTGTFSGSMDAESLRALRYFQARHGMEANGVIDEALLQQLVRQSDAALAAVGYQTLEDAATGMRMGLPLALVSDDGATAVGRVWRSPHRGIEIEAVRLQEKGGSLSALYDVLKRPAGGRSITATSFSDDSFTISGREDDRAYTLRFDGRGDDLRGLVISFGDGAAPAMIPYATVALQLFDPFGAPSDLVAEEAGSAPMTAVAGHDTTRADADLAASLAPAPAPGLNRPQGPETDSSGSGFVVSADGWVLTNAHVAGSCRQVLVGTYGPADSVVLDRVNDLALVHVGARLGPPLRLAAGMPRLGEDVLALGFPLRSILADSLNVTRGNVSSLLGLANDARYLQISAPVQPGNSGGPLVDLSGRVVGVVTAKLDAVAIADATGDIPQSINFAIRPDAVAKFLTANGIAFDPAPAPEHFDSVADTTADVADSVLPILCLGG
ncbi:S1C family serine protease [Aureimonas glaciei]|uniref:S1C family serine protease n=1 Tax=Aureimonas glaciei TaxID=1776957 RepID=UPI00166B130B|nr:serine protease [Aureimonas glaciei]